jgi:hypothetical protein
MTEEFDEGSPFEHDARRLNVKQRLSDDVRDMREELAMMRKQLEEFRSREESMYRTSRDQELRAADSIHEDTDADAWEEPALLDAKVFRDALPGQALLWVTTHLAGQPYQGNVFKSMNQGWTPVLADSLPKELRGILEVDFRDQQVIGVHGAVLMQRPIEVHERAIRARRKAAQGQMDEVKRRLYGTRSREDRGGVKLDRFEPRVQVERGRRQAPLDADG